MISKLITNYCQFQYLPYTIISTDNVTRITRLTGGIEFQFLNALKYYLNFTYQIFDCNIVITLGAVT